MVFFNISSDRNILPNIVCPKKQTFPSRTCQSIMSISKGTHETMAQLYQNVDINVNNITSSAML